MRLSFKVNICYQEFVNGSGKNVGTGVSQKESSLVSPSTG